VARVFAIFGGNVKLPMGESCGAVCRSRFILPGARWVSMTLAVAALLLTSGGTHAVFAADADPVINDPNQPMQVAQARTGATTVDDDLADDPLEGLNRAIFQANEFIYALLLRPVADFYTLLLPPPVQTAIGNMLTNFREPVVLANSILQGDPGRAWQTGQRFVINSTLGVGGILDPASEMGIARIKEDFGQTLGVWGVGDSPYLVLPLLGPSNPRDAIGRYLVDGYFDPLGHYLDNTHQDEAANSRLAVGAVDEYGGVMKELDSIKRTSIDYYAALRSLYLQKRRAEIANGGNAGLPPMPDIDYDMNYGLSQAR